MTGDRKLPRLLAASFGVANGTLALALFVAGFWVFRLGSIGIDMAKQRGEFAAGMLMGGIAWVAWLSAVVVCVLTYACWRIYRHACLADRWRFSDSLVLCIGSVPSAAVITWGIGRWLSGP